LPYEDEFGQLWQLVGEEPVTLEWLLWPVSEHRIPLSRLVWLGVLRAADYDFRAGMLLNVLLLAGLAAALVRAASRLRGRPSPADAFLPVLVLSLGQHENLLWSMQVLFVLPAVLYGVFLTESVRIDAHAPPSVLASLAVALLPLADASGLVLSLPLALWLLADGLVRRRWRAARGRVVLALAALSIAVSAAFLLTLEKPDNVPDYDASRALQGATEVMGGSLGPASVSSPLRNRAWAAVAGLLAVGAFALLARTRHRGGPGALRAEALLACLLAPLGLFLTIGFARAALGPGACMLTKYSTLGATLLVCLYFVAVLGGGRLARYVAFGLLGAALLAQNAAIRQALRYGETRRRGYDAFSADVARGLTADAIVARNRKTLYAEITPEMFEWMRGLNRHRIGPFARHPAPLDRDSGPRAEEAIPLAPVGAHDAVWNDGVARVTGGDPYLVFRLPQPRDVVAVRIEFDTASRRPETRIEAFWALSGTPRADFDWWQRSVNATVPPGAGRRELELPVYDTIDLLRLDLEPLATEFRLHAIRLVVRPA
ncbi:MAG TPA: hypothetical protein VFM88_12330, partial [Vicinamibacteria bacterium]|nr:hypothetical protein [Vicinamibacteria bacterium]